MSNSNGLRAGIRRIDESIFQQGDALGNDLNLSENSHRVKNHGGVSPEAGPRASIGRRNELFYARIDRIYRNFPLILSGDIVATLLVLTIFSVMSQQLGTPLVVWFVSLNTLTALRYFLYYQSSKLPLSQFSYESRYQYLAVSEFVSGIGWGLIPLTIAADSPPTLSALAALWLAGMLTGAASTTSSMRAVFAAYVVPASLAFIASSLLHLQQNSGELVASYLLFLCFIVYVGLRTRKDVGAHIEAELDNKLMRTKLEQEKRLLKDKEDEISIQRRREATLAAQKISADMKLAAAMKDRHLLLDAIQEGIFGISQVGAITFINKAGLRMLGYQEDEVIGMSALLLLNPSEESGSSHRVNNQPIFESYIGGNSLELVDSLFRTQSESFLPVRYSAEPVLENGRLIGSVVIFTDLSKLKEMETMLLQSQKMEAIGRLTGGVAHDFNNLLTVILGNLQFLERRLGSDEKSLLLVKKVMAAAKNGADLNNRLLSFSREQSLQASNVDIDQMLIDMNDFFDRMLGENIQLTCIPCEEPCFAASDKTQLENAILNLCVNAKDAMPDGGTLTISAKLVRRPTLLDHLYESALHESENFVQLSVSDNGSGMPEEVAEKIFEPFFTTKSKGRGTGLGLSTVYGFLNQSGGGIQVNSKLGEGTSFRLYLPPSREDLRHSAEGQEPPKKRKRHAGTVLIVEDNESVRDVAVQMLRSMGYRVIEASDGSLGLLKFEAHPEIDLVFSDVVMPGGLNGVEMAQKILALAPDTPILLATGFIDRDLRAQVATNPELRCIAKPYDTNEIPQLIATMLDERTVADSSAAL